MPEVGHEYDVFLSHNSTDKQLVEEVAKLLKSEGLQPFLDKWHLVPGDPWQEALEEALERSTTVAVLFGPKGPGPWHHEEMRAALESAVQDGKRIIPTVLPGGDRSQLPPFLKRRTLVDLSRGIDDVSDLIAGIRGVPLGSGTGTTMAEGRVEKVTWKWLRAAPLVLGIGIAVVLAIMDTAKFPEAPDERDSGTTRLESPATGLEHGSIHTLQRTDNKSLPRPAGRLVRKSSLPPTSSAWFSASDTDQYGRWVDVRVPSRHNNVPDAMIRLRWIDPGRFKMGSPVSERGRWAGEGPQHEVTLTTGFWMAESETTQALWKAVVGENPSRFNGDDQPVEQVSWHRVQSFLKALNERVPGLDAKLPTEAQWEYACRAGTTEATYGVRKKVAWFDQNSGSKPHPVKRKQPNRWGLYDMLGNVWEWCEDYGYRVYHDGHSIDPSGP